MQRTLGDTLGRIKQAREVLFELAAWLTAIVGGWQYFDPWYVCQLETMPILVFWITVTLLSSLAILAGFLAYKQFRRGHRLGLWLGYPFAAIVLFLLAYCVYKQIPASLNFLLIKLPATRTVTAEMPIGLVADYINTPNAPGGDGFQEKIKLARRNEQVQQTHATYISYATTGNCLPRSLYVPSNQNVAVAAMLFGRQTDTNSGWEEILPRIGFGQLNGPKSTIQIPARANCGERLSLVVFVFPLDSKSSGVLSKDIHDLLHIK